MDNEYDQREKAIFEVAEGAQILSEPIREFLMDLRPHVLEKYEGAECKTDNIILQALIFNISAHTAEMVRATHSGDLSDEKVRKIYHDLTKRIGELIQNVFGKNMGCDGILIGKTVDLSKKKGDDGGS